MRLRLLDAQRRRSCPSASDDRDGRELVLLHDAEADAGVFLDLLLEVLGELLVALGGDDGQRVDLEAAQALALLVDAEAQAAADGLAALALGPISRRAQIWKTLGLSQPSAGPSGRR